MSKALLFEPRYTLANVVDVTGNSAGTLQNWLARGVVTLQHKASIHHGRTRLFSGLDILRLSVMTSIVMNIGLPASAAWEISGLAQDRIAELIQRGSAGEDVTTLPAVSLAILPNFDPVLVTDRCTSDELVRLHKLHVPHLLLPLDQMITDVIERLQAIEPATRPQPGD